MNIYRNIVLINSSEIIDIVRRTLSKIDARLVNHGERVGYLAGKIYQYSVKKPAVDYAKLLILCVLHDIGAYKTEEIDDMVRFETMNPHKHSLFGYVFLKNTTFLSEYAEALLYHHTDYQHMQKLHSRYQEYAELIFLSDRADILLHSNNPNLLLLSKMAGTKFHPDYVEALLRAEATEKISEKITNGTYRSEIENSISNLNIPNCEIMDYLKLLVYAIDFRSPYTVTHTSDTTIISLEIGKLFGLSEQELQTLYLGAFLHDIGKIAIPYAILEKPEKLTTQEYDIIKTHITEGEEILRGVVSDEVSDIALRHHEKLDGSGYVLGLKKEDLTLPQRIVAVSDILSALSQKRSYKEPFPKEKVISILKDMKAAGQICPNIVDTVCINYDKILQNTEKSQDPVRMLYQNLLSEYSKHSEELVALAKGQV